MHPPSHARAAESALAPSRVSTRRAFLIAGATFAVGAAFGGGLGHRIATATAGATERDEPDPLDTDDPELRELRRLAVEAPLAELVERRLIYVHLLTKSYWEDPILWRGVRRLIDATLGGHQMEQRRLFARFLAQVLEGTHNRHARALLPFAPELRAVE